MTFVFIKINNNSEKLESFVTEKKAPVSNYHVVSLFEDWERNPRRLVQIEEALKGEYSVRSLVDSSLRMSAENPQKVLIACSDLCTLGQAIFNASFSTRLKIAIFHDLNIIGYLFDRSEDNYRICYKLLDAFLWALLGFKEKLTSAELELWNASTFCGTTVDHQFETLRGFLR